MCEQLFWGRLIAARLTEKESGRMSFARTQAPVGRQEDEGEGKRAFQASLTFDALSFIFSSSVAFSVWNTILLCSPTYGFLSVHSALRAHLHRLGSEWLWGDVYDVHFINGKYWFVKERFSAE